MTDNKQDVCLEENDLREVLARGNLHCYAHTTAVALTTPPEHHKFLTCVRMII